MRMVAGLGVIGALLVVASESASAGSAVDDYPTQITDRPLLLPDLVIGAGAAVATAANQTLHLQLGDFVTGGVEVTAGLGGMQPYAGVGFALHSPSTASVDAIADAVAGVHIALGGHAALTLGGTSAQPLRDDYQAFEVHGDFTAKALITPHVLAAAVDVGVEGDEVQLRPPTFFMPAQTASDAIGYVGGTLLGQASDQLGVAGGAQIDVPLAASAALNEKVGGSASVLALYCLGRVDLWGEGSLHDIGRTNDSAFTAGVDVRF